MYQIGWGGRCQAEGFTQGDDRRREQQYRHVSFDLTRASALKPRQQLVGGCVCNEWSRPAGRTGRADGTVAHSPSLKLFIRKQRCPAALQQCPFVQSLHQSLVSTVELNRADWRRDYLMVRPNFEPLERRRGTQQFSSLPDLSKFHSELTASEIRGWHQMAECHGQISGRRNLERLCHYASRITMQ